jgi:hypothetical protein
MRTAAWLLVLASLGSLLGCASRHSRSEQAPDGSAAAPDAEKETRPAYDTGQALILEYHEIAVEEKRWARSVEAFRADLQRLYDEWYRPVTLSEYLDASFDLPPGSTPVVLTFDDSRPGQFRYLENGEIDPDCAVGILEAFHRHHPDFPAKAVFYVLPENAFGQWKDRARKLQWLVQHGYELGNHTLTHPRSLAKLTDEEVQREIGGAARSIIELAPEARPTSISLPSGIPPENPELLQHGMYEGEEYRLRSAVLVGAGPAPAPHSPDLDPYRLPRVQATEGEYGITFWLDYFAEHPEKRLRVR